MGTRRGRQPVLGQLREQQRQEGLRPVAGDTAADIDLGVDQLRGRSCGLRGESNIGATDLTAQLQRCLGRRLVVRGDKPRLYIERHQRRELVGAADVLGEAEQFGQNAHARCGLRLQRHADAPLRGIRRVLDPAVAVKGDGARGQKVQRLDVQGPVSQG